MTVHPIRGCSDQWEPQCQAWYLSPPKQDFPLDGTDESLIKEAQLIDQALHDRLAADSTLRMRAAGLTETCNGGAVLHMVKKLTPS